MTSRMESLWREHKNGDCYARWDRLAAEEPETIALLRKEHGAQAETDEYYLYANYHEKFGWSVGRKPKKNWYQEQKTFSVQRQQQQSPTVINTTEITVAEILAIVTRIESKIDKNHLNENEWGGE